MGAGSFIILMIFPHLWNYLLLLVFLCALCPFSYYGFEFHFQVDVFIMVCLTSHLYNINFSVWQPVVFFLIWNQDNSVDAVDTVLVYWWVSIVSPESRKLSWFPYNKYIVVPLAKFVLANQTNNYNQYKISIMWTCMSVNTASRKSHPTECKN